jgi:S1-C subfamily serine protease
MDESPPSTSERWRGLLKRVRTLLRRTVPFASGVIAALVALLLYHALTPLPPQLTQRDVSTTVAQIMASATVPPAYSANVYQIIMPSLVLIQTDQADLDGKTGHGLGTGFVVDDRGDILTALHVVVDATDIKLTFADGSKSDARILVKQPEHDTAVLQAMSPPAKLVPAVLGNPNSMRVGDEAYVVGNPYGLYGSMSSGVISGFERSFKLPSSNIRLEHLIQFDSAVNPGNSGGPLLNRSGEVIGIITALLNPTEQNTFIGIGFAVPITLAGGAAGAPPY